MHPGLDEMCAWHIRLRYNEQVRDGERTLGRLLASTHLSQPGRRLSAATGSFTCPVATVLHGSR